ncbi:MAG: type II secretion system F family protein [Candidatus Thalassarchaeaceae archaeon]|nr:type II secretion system F family protein [Candidatus Thalassarchaeaceae archaeon]
MARKKDKIRVNLELPKDDKTQSNFIVILLVGMFFGIGCLGFWITNSGLVLSQANGNPAFLNMACPDSFDAMDPAGPTYFDNQTCFLTKESPNEEVWSDSWDRIQPPGQAKSFQVPGMSPKQLIDNGQVQQHPQQPMTVTVSADAYQSYPFEVTVYHYAQGSSNREHILSVQCVANDGTCSETVQHVEPGGEYQLWVYFPVPSSGDSSVMLNSVDFTVSVDSWDGIPENMNNKSLWLGPEVNLGPLSLRPTMFVNFFGLGFLVMVYPAALYSDRQMMKIEKVEAKFPDFLRDLAEYWKGGLSMTLAVRTLANSEYGALNDEIKKMSDQLSWGIAFGDVLEMFAERVGTPLVQRAVSLVTEANKAGGKISDILVTAANDSREIQFLKGERARAIGSYIAVIWVSFIVFIGVIIVLSNVFIPAIASSNSGGESETIGNMQINAVDPLFFLVVFFYGVTAQAMGNGAMAGIMATGRLATGMKHAGMMMIICLILFNLAAFNPTLIGVPQGVGMSPALGYIPITGG